MSKHVRDYYHSKTTGLQVVEATDEGVDGANLEDYGCELLEVTREEVDALLAGKAWVFPVNGGEYTHCVVMK